jgi:sortase B
MENSGMFGDLDLYKDQTFFDENTTGTLILPDRAYQLEIFACLVLEAGDDTIFDPGRWQTDINGLLSYVSGNNLYLRKETVEALERMDNPQILALSTCSTEFTDARTIILAVMEPYQAAD